MQISKSAIVYIGVPDLYYGSTSGSSSLGGSGGGLADKIVTIDKSRIPASHKWAPQAPVAQAFYNIQVLIYLLCFYSPSSAFLSIFPATELIKRHYRARRLCLRWTLR